MVVIGDIAGQFDALMRLVRKFKPDEKIVLVGDLVDRGPDSKKVVEWAMTAKNVVTLFGNHESLMIDAWMYSCDYNYERIYSGDDWLNNGGMATIQSYWQDEGLTFSEALRRIPVEHIEFLRTRPLTYQEDGLFVSHAPWDQNAKTDLERIWHRNEPKKMPGVKQIFGHNAHWGLRSFYDEEGIWAQCIDQSHYKVLTAWHDGEIIVEPYRYNAQMTQTFEGKEARLFIDGQEIKAMSDVSIGEGE